MHPARILIVDDSEMVRVLARQTLEKAGHRVRCVNDGNLATEAFLDFRPELILLDVLMPILDGYEACAAIRRLPGGAHVPIVMMSGLHDGGAIHRAFEAGATDFIGKPIPWPKLGSRVRHLLRAAQNMIAATSRAERLEADSRSMAPAYWQWDLADDRVSLSKSACAILGVDASLQRMSFERFMQCLHDEDRPRVRDALRRETPAGRPCRLDCRIDDTGRGEARHVLLQSGPEPQRVGIARQVSGTLRDVTPPRRPMSRRASLVHHDPLTGLSNRLLFKEQLARALPRALRQARNVAVLTLDLDKFDAVNKRYGTAVGNQLLKSIATRLADSLRGEDGLMRSAAANDDDPPPGPLDSPASLARMDGDEFTILLTELTHVQDAAKVAIRMLDALRQPLVVAGHPVSVSGSVGIAVYPTDGVDPGSLLMHADSAMHNAKAAGGNCFKFHSKAMNASAFERLSLEANLRQALARGEFVLHYQPKIEIATRRIAGIEALLRWQHPGIGLVSPLEFLPLAEETGLIAAIGEWVLFEACRQAQAWRAAGHPPLCVAVNLSARQFRQPNLLDVVSRALAQAGLPADQLELEIPESGVMHDIGAATATMQRLRHLGCRLSVDDFGTGYSSLAYLTRFPIDALKIDRSFIQDLPAGSDDAAIVRAILGLAKGLQIRVVAEGVETAAQLALLAELQCDEAQGFFISSPLPAEHIPALLDADRTLSAAA